jgi:hypothetical protein
MRPLDDFSAIRRWDAPCERCSVAEPTALIAYFRRACQELPKVLRERHDLVYPSNEDELVDAGGETALRMLLLCGRSGAAVCCCAGSSGIGNALCAARAWDFLHPLHRVCTGAACRHGDLCSVRLLLCVRRNACQCRIWVLLPLHQLSIACDKSVRYFAILGIS